MLKFNQIKTIISGKQNDNSTEASTLIELSKIKPEEKNKQDIARLVHNLSCTDFVPHEIMGISYNSCSSGNIISLSVLFNERGRKFNQSIELPRSCLSRNAKNLLKKLPDKIDDNVNITESYEKLTKIANIINHDLNPDKPTTDKDKDKNTEIEC
jgi:hypothetical protein